MGIDISTSALTPAAILGQATTRISFINELCCDHGVGPARFGELLKQLLDEEYPNRRLRVWCDPAAQFGGDDEGGQLAALDTLQRALDVPILIPFDGSNELSLRLSAVDQELRGYLEPNTRMLISPKCPQYIKGIAGAYRFKKLSEAASNDYEDKPEKKHPTSDLQDGGQYLIGGFRGRAAIIKNAIGANKTAGEGSQWGGQSGGKKLAVKGGFNPHNY